MKLNLLILSALCCTVGSLKAGIIDDFSTDTSTDYNSLKTYDGSDYIPYGTTNGQFTPSGSGAAVFIRNDGPVLQAGGSISLELDALNYNYQGMGLSVSSDIDDLASYATVALVNTPPQQLKGVSLSTPWDPSNGPLTLSINRLADGTDFDYSLSGGNITTMTGSFAFGSNTNPLYFGMYVQGFPISSGYRPVTVDNLSLTAPAAAPEPSTYALLGLGLGFVAFLQMRRAARLNV